MYSLDTLIEILDLKKFFWMNSNLEMLEQMAMKYNLYDIINKTNISDETILLTYESFLNKNPDIMIYDMLHKTLYLPKDKIINNHLMEFLKYIIDEIKDYEGVNYSDIKYIDSGASTRVYRIGNKVLKLSNHRNNFVMPNNKRYLKPILRTNISLNVPDKPNLYIEITEEAELVNLNEEQLYDVYKLFRQEGIVLLDMRSSNLGKLKRKNKIYFDKIPTKESINYLTDVKDELNKGEIVIIDNEDVISLDEFLSIKMYYNGLLVSDFEDRYISEKEKVLKK